MLDLAAFISVLSLIILLAWPNRQAPHDPYDNPDNWGEQ
jgi:hypothetical protein